MNSIYFLIILASVIDDFCGVQLALSHSINVNYQNTNGETALIIGEMI